MREIENHRHGGSEREGQKWNHPKKNSQNLSSSITASFLLQYGSFILYFSHLFSTPFLRYINKMSGPAEARFPMLLLAYQKQSKVGVGVGWEQWRWRLFNSHLIYDYRFWINFALIIATFNGKIFSDAISLWLYVYSLYALCKDWNQKSYFHCFALN